MKPRPFVSTACGRRWLANAAGGGLLVLLVSGASAEPIASTPLERTPWFRLVKEHGEKGARCDVHWSDTPLSAAAESLREACGVTVWIDRRVDPGALIRSGGGKGDVGRALADAAGLIGTKHTRIAGAHCLGPDADVLGTRLANRLQEVARLPARQRRVLLARDAIEWPRLTEPRSLLVAALKGRGIGLADAERVPHDRWAASRLPPAPLADQLTLLLAGFTLDWRLEDGGRQVRLVPAGAPKPVAAIHRIGRSATRSMDGWQQRLGPSANLTLGKKNKVTLVGSVEQHAALREMLNANDASRDEAQHRKPRKDRLADKRFTLRVADQPAGPLLDSLGKRLELEIRYTEGAEAALAAAGRVSFQTRDATLDELLRRFSEAAGVAASLRGGTVLVEPAAAR